MQLGRVHSKEAEWTIAVISLGNRMNHMLQIVSLTSRVARLMAVVAAIVGTASVVSGTPLNLTLEPHPDIYSSFVSVSYDASTDEFAASSPVSSLNTGSGFPPLISPGNFSITATIDENGLASAGTLSVSGDVLSYTGLLLEGTLTAFGFKATGGQPLEFLFTVAGGQAAGLFGGVGSTIGTILHYALPPTLFGGDFSALFSADADTGRATVPDQATTIYLLGGSLLLLGMARRWNRRWTMLDAARRTSVC